MMAVQQHGWLQEMPDPITKMVWDNAVLISRKTAEELQLAGNGDVVQISVNGRSIEGPIWVQPGQADYSVGLALGYGRVQSGRVGKGVGFQRVSTPHSCHREFRHRRHTEKDWQDLHLRLHPGPLVHRKAGRLFAKRISNSQKESAIRQSMDEPAPVSGSQIKGKEPRESPQPMYPNPFDEAKKKGRHQWGDVPLT